MNTLCKNDKPELLAQVLQIIGDKYSALLIRSMHDEPQRFKDFEEKIEGISPRTLSQRLSTLEAQGVICKEVCPESPGRSQYELTQAGKDLDEVLHAMANWSKKHSSCPFAST